MDTDAEKIYQDTLSYLYGFVDYSLTRGGFQAMAGNFDLARMAEFMQIIWNPHLAYPILHVAGTKGKGSVCTLCAAALQAAGHRVGLYTSPHLQDYAERIQIDGQPIPHADLIALVDEFRPFLDRGTKLTTFEITTALAFLYFARQGVTAAVIEVGLGGRLDATNIVTPVVSVITSISYDHIQVLGNTLAEIAGEKAGIIKPGVPVIVAPQEEEARQAIARIAVERPAPLLQVGRDIGYQALEHDLDGQRLRVWAGQPPDAAGALDLHIRLLGSHQVENAAVAYAALHTAAGRGLSVGAAAIRQGFAAAVWPGRFEVLRRDPAVVVDSAHNRDSARKLRQTLVEYFPGKRVILIFGASEDKDISGMFAELLPGVSRLILTRSFHPRAADMEVLLQEAGRYLSDAIVVAAVEDALAEALRRQTPDDLVLAAGSIFIAAGVRETWYNQSGLGGGHVE